MDKFTPVSFGKLVKKLRQFGFAGPYDGGKHLIMLKGEQRLTITNPHKKKDIGVGLLIKILNRANISRDDWIKKG